MAVGTSASWYVCRPEQAAGPRGFLWEMGPLGPFPSNQLFAPNLQKPDTVKTLSSSTAPGNGLTLSHRSVFPIQTPQDGRGDETWETREPAAGLGAATPQPVSTRALGGSREGNMGTAALPNPRAWK